MSRATPKNNATVDLGDSLFGESIVDKLVEDRKKLFPWIDTFNELSVVLIFVLVITMLILIGQTPNVESEETKRKYKGKPIKPCPACNPRQNCPQCPRCICSA